MDMFKFKDKYGKNLKCQISRCHTVTIQTGQSKQYRPRSNVAERDVWSGPTLFASHQTVLFYLFRFWQYNNITKTCLYNFDPFKPHFYIVKQVYRGTRINYFFLFLLKNTEAVLTSTHNLCFEQKYETISAFYPKIFSFWRWNLLCI